MAWPDDVALAAGGDQYPIGLDPPHSAEYRHLAGPLLTPAPLTVIEVRCVTDDVVALRLARSDGAPLPEWTPGSHVELRLPSGRLRQYSLCGDPADRSSWRIAVLREPAGRGGSVELHGLATVGATFSVRGPRNHFPLVDTSDYLFLASGIGIVPILAMVRAVAPGGRRFRVMYCGPTLASMAFVDELAEAARYRLTLQPQDELGPPDIDGLLAGVGPDTAVYCCATAVMVGATEQACAERGFSDRLHVERFTEGDD